MSSKSLGNTYKRSSPLWKRTPVITFNNSPKKSILSSKEIFKRHNETWKEDQDMLKFKKRNKTLKKIQENKKKNRYIRPTDPKEHKYYVTQQADNFWSNVQRKFENDMDWAANEVPHFGGKKKSNWKKKKRKISVKKKK